MSWTYDTACETLNLSVNMEKALGTDRLAPPSLERMLRLVAALGHPEHAFRCVHVTGTNGKTSTTKLVSSLLTAHGLRVGTFVSPHIDRVNDRISVAGESISDSEFAAHVGAAVDAVEGCDKPTYFELVTAAALTWFAACRVDVGVVEVGLLGRWDATNIVDGAVSVVTNVGTDHADMAGGIDRIAFEKAGIIKPGSHVVLGDVPRSDLGFFLNQPQRCTWRLGEDFDATCTRAVSGGQLVDIRTPGGDYPAVGLGLYGDFQAENAAIAVAAAQAFLGRPLSRPAVDAGLSAPSLNGRLEVVCEDPLVVLDGAHNSEAAAALARGVITAFGRGDWVVVFAALRGHDTRATLAALRQIGISRVFLCVIDSPRAISLSELTGLAADLGIPASPEGAAATAVAAAMGAGNRVLVTGSFQHLAPAHAAVMRQRKSGA